MAEYISFQPTDFFKTQIYTGTGATLAQTFPQTTAMQPDLTWIKCRDAGARSHVLTDSVRGVNSQISSDDNAAETTLTDALTSFDSDGFTLGADTGGGEVNNSGDDFVSWNWKAGTTTGLSGGTITPTSYSINTTSGFGVYKYTGTGSAGTIAHGLGVAPEMVIVKKYNTTADWYVYHKDMPSGNGYHMTLNTSAAQASGTEWNSTNPTSTVFSLGANSNVNASAATFIAYVFAPKRGYSKFQEYWGNGQTSDGTFVYTGFRPAFILIKRSALTGNWQIFDDKRLGYNGGNSYLAPNDANAENTGGQIDIVSNGFKMRNNGTYTNGSGDTYIYAAFAEFPIVSSNNLPTVAR